MKVLMIIILIVVQMLSVKLLLSIDHDSMHVGKSRRKSLVEQIGR